MKTANENQNALWDIIEREKRTDKMIKWVNRIAWSVILVVLLVFLVFTIQDYSRTMSLYQKGLIPLANVKLTVTPFLKVLGLLALIVGVLATVGMFLRLRTTSMLEIQQRLANLEQIVTSEK